MPVRPAEVMLGKLTPNFLGSGLQVLIILGMARWVFDVPLLGSWPLLATAIAFFVLALALPGYLISTVARNQMQAMQVTFIFFLPSILLSGFMFPFRGLPGWAQTMGEILPLTHFLRLVRGVMLKGTGVVDVLPHVWPLLLFSIVVGTLTLKRYCQVLDD